MQNSFHENTGWHYNCLEPIVAVQHNCQRDQPLEEVLLEPDRRLAERSPGRTGIGRVDSSR